MKLFISQPIAGKTDKEIHWAKLLTFFNKSLCLISIIVSTIETVWKGTKQYNNKTLDFVSAIYYYDIVADKKKGG